MNDNNDNIDISSIKEQNKESLKKLEENSISLESSLKDLTSLSREMAMRSEKTKKRIHELFNNIKHD